MASSTPRSARRKSSSSTLTLPFELVEDILLRSPPESLVRFKCVCKSWSDLFKDPAFISHHLSISNQNHSSSDNILLFTQVSTNTNESTHRVTKLFSLSSNDNHASISGKEMFTSNIIDDSMRISGHCNGLICFYRQYFDPIKENDVALFNPSTRELRFLPRSFCFCNKANVVGFGCDPKSDDDLKIVRIWGHPTFHYISSTNEFIANDVVIVEEYALSTNSWRVLDNTNLGDFLFNGYDFAMHLKGTLYWWANDKEHDCLVLLALIVGDEVFHKVPLPRHFGLRDDVEKHVGVLNDSISLATYTCVDGHTSIHMWIMNGLGVANGCTWTKLCCIGLPQLTPLTFWKGGNQLLVKETRTQISKLHCKGKMREGKMRFYRNYCRTIVTSYDINTFKKVDAEVEGHPDIISMEATNYVKSIVSMKGRTGNDR